MQFDHIPENNISFTLIYRDTYIEEDKRDEAKRRAHSMNENTKYMERIQIINAK